jgi:hypothetical protein
MRDEHVFIQSYGFRVNFALLVSIKNYQLFKDYIN